MSRGKLGKRLFVLALMVGGMLAATASAESKARIVRLSNVEGSVQMDRGDGEGFEKAFLNMPVIEGAKLRTGSDGRAEVEFEDGSVLHIVPESKLNFTSLSLGDDGQKLSTVELVDGTAYANIRAKKGDRFVLNFGHESVTLTEAAHFRVDVTNSEATLANFNGEVQVTGPAGEVKVEKRHTVKFDLGSNDKYALKKGVEEESYDGWDKEQAEYHERYASNGGYNVSSPYAYGISDLNYYGSYLNVPGYGWGWQPYFTDAGWSPFADGGWVSYPGCGFMWVSAYPWGWMPYRYGNWIFAPGYGWIWQPGYWTSWYAVPQIVNPPNRIHVPTPPVRGHGTVMVGRGLTAFPASGPPARVTISPGSASLGVERGSVHNLGHFARQIDKNPRPMEVRTVPTIRSESSAGMVAGPARSGFDVRPGAPTMHDVPAGRVGSAPHVAPAPSRPH